MPDDVQPVHPIGEEPPAVPTQPVKRAATAGDVGSTAHVVARQAPASGDARGLALGDAAAHEQLEHPVRVPTGVDSRSTVHDAAVHGNRIAGAIEQGERAQQLAGAAASAGSGQAAVVKLEQATDPESTEVDVLDPIDPISKDPRRQDPRSREEQLADDDLRP